MPKLKPGTILVTNEEELRIQAGIDADPDAYSLTDEEWEKVKPGARLGDIGFAIQRFAESNGCSVVREFCGHGIGQVFHEEPQVLHYGKPGTGETLQEGMTFTIEPMINAGKKDIKELGDGWTIVTRDHSLSAQWEHTILVTPTGYEVLTLSEGSPALPDFVTTTCC